jgi:hypothetical protein
MPNKILSGLRQQFLSDSIPRWNRSPGQSVYRNGSNGKSTYLWQIGVAKFLSVSMSCELTSWLSPEAAHGMPTKKYFTSYGSNLTTCKSGVMPRVCVCWSKLCGAALGAQREVSQGSVILKPYTLISLVTKSCSKSRSNEKQKHIFLCGKSKRENHRTHDEVLLQLRGVLQYMRVQTL